MPNPWLPRWGDPAVRWNRGWRYPTAAEILFAKTQPTLKGTMKKSQNYFPSRMAEQPEWLGNFATKLPNYETPLGLPPAYVDACVASANFLIYVLDPWLTQVRGFGPAATTAMDLLISGSGPAPVVLPVFTAPALPTGVAPVPPGALNRIFDMVQLVKSSPGYNDTIGQDLGIIASGTATPTTMVADHMVPEVKFDTVRGATSEAVKIRFKKQGHGGVYIECKRGTEDWTFLAIDSESPYLDDRPLLTAATPEVRNYRLRYWDTGTPNGDWTEVATITVGPYPPVATYRREAGSNPGLAFCVSGCVCQRR